MHIHEMFTFVHIRKKFIFLKRIVIDRKNVLKSLWITAMFFLPCSKIEHGFQSRTKLHFRSSGDFIFCTVRKIDFNYLSNWMKYDGAATITIWTKWNSIWLRNERKTVTTIIFHSTFKGLHILTWDRASKWLTL